MKSYLSKALVVVSILLAVGLAATKWSDNAQLDTAATTINDYSNRLDTAQGQILVRDGALLTLSNTLAATSLTFSNQLMEAQSTAALQTEQITNLNRQVAATAAENQALGQSVMDLTNQLAALTSQNAHTEASLAQANTNLVQAGKDYAQWEDRFRRDVAERIVVERKFNSLPELESQLEQLKQFPVGVISAHDIYAGLDVVVNGDGKFYVISPD
jgi:chromosome segregation ATPase